MELSRVCYKCRQERPLTEEYFYNNSSEKSGFARRCIKCDKQNAKTLKQKQYNVKSQENRLSQGLCRYCIIPRIKNSKWFCEKHYLEDVCRKYLGTRKRWNELKLLLNSQDGKCPYTG